MRYKKLLKNAIISLSIALMSILFTFLYYIVLPRCAPQNFTYARNEQRSAENEVYDVNENAEEIRKVIGRHDHRVPYDVITVYGEGL